ncbi:MAG: FAD-binding oxidoreductase [Hyphomicrobium sp.]
MSVSGLPLDTPTAEVIQRLVEVVGPAHALTDPAMQRPYLVEWRDRYVGKSPLVLRPGATDEVSRILAIANAARVGVVPQSGNTGLVGGQIPYETGAEIVVSLGRLKAVRDIDAAAQSMTVEAGVTLGEVRARADAVGRMFPLSLASEGSCQIGGNLATNAGGVGVLAYGTARDQVLGLEVVLADGRVWNGLRTLKKDNTGYDLRHLFIGSEGTLGIITAAVLKLYPRPAEVVTAMLAVESLRGTRDVFRRVQARFGSALTAFEFIPAIAMDFVTRHVAGTRRPFAALHPWYVLIDVSAPAPDGRVTAQLEETLSGAMGDSLVIDAVIARSGQQARELWRLREEISDAQKFEGGSIKHDISVPVPLIAEFVARADAIVERLVPGARPVPFGHFGDGNVHYNVSQPPGSDKATFLAMWETVSHEIHGLVGELGGSISAEHGIGRMKRAELRRFKSEVELDMMRGIKRTLDPNGILNPGKVL